MGTKSQWCRVFFSAKHVINQLFTFMKSLYESILKSTKSGAFRFTDEMLVEVNEPNVFVTQFNLLKLKTDWCAKKSKDDNSRSDAKLIWEALCNMPPKFTEKEARKALVHKFEWSGPEDEFFKTIFKGYLINENDFDFFVSDSEQFNFETITVATHERTGKHISRNLFTIRL